MCKLSYNLLKNEENQKNNISMNFNPTKRIQHSNNN